MKLKYLAFASARLMALRRLVAVPPTYSQKTRTAIEPTMKYGELSLKYFVDSAGLVDEC